MSRTKTVTKITEMITHVAPELRFAAAYNADDPQLAGSMKLYENRCFIYVLTIQFEGTEKCLYVGETRFQYGRFLQHKMNFSFDRIYLYECEEHALCTCETAVIRSLTPLFNKNNNPFYCRYNRVLDINNVITNNRNEVTKCLRKWADYCDAGLYGFALPPAIYRLIKASAQSHGVTVSEELTILLEACYVEDIADELNRTTLEEEKTNLVTTNEFGAKHGKSQEQIKQYLHQDGRLTGRKFGRDWVLIDDEKLPEDRRKKEVIS